MVCLTSSSGLSQTTIAAGEPELVTYTNLYDWNTAYLPEEFNGSNGWSEIVVNSCGDVEEIVRTEPLIWGGQTICLEIDDNGTSLQTSTVNGVGYIGKSGEAEDDNEDSVGTQDRKEAIPNHRKG